MSDRLMALLEELGYGVAFREVGWVECMLVREQERWVGRGRDDREALEDAIHQACPSSLARALLARAISEEVVVEAPTVAIESAPSVEVAPAPVVAVAPIETKPNGVVPATRDRTRDEALEELDVLLAKIRADEEDLALCTPQRQRLVLLAWIARARAIQDAFLGDDDVDDVVTSIARAIGTLSKRWWPGSVPALQQAAVPEDAGRALPDDDEYEPSTWSEVAQRAERGVRMLEDNDAARGFDDYGWADAAACVPPPTRPNEILASVVGGLSDFDPDEATANDIGRLTRLAQRLRYVRTSVTNVLVWSTALGRLRRCAARDRFLFAELARALDPTFAPQRPWASLVDVATPRKPEVDPAVRVAEVDSILAVIPEVGDRDALRTWLGRALPLTDTHHDKIANAMRPHVEAIIAFKPEDFAGAGRRIHRRLRKLQETLSGSEPTSAPPSEVSLPSLPIIEDERPVDVVARTRGRRAVFVTNRTDPDLQVRLRDVCEFSELDWVESAPRSIDAVADAIANKKYDVVIAATGFLDHPVDTKLSHACRGASVPYVRANRGRVGACMRALARDLSD
jgi:hypothetical protein